MFIPAGVDVLEFLQDSKVVDGAEVIIRGSLEGAKHIFMPVGRTWVKTYAGDDVIESNNSGGSRIDTGAGDDTIIGNRLGTEDLIIDAGSGNDSVTGSAGDDVITLGEGDDRVRGFGGNDVIYGGGGDDRITSEPKTGQTVTAYGGDGNDVLIGGVGADAMFGGAGDDAFTPGGGSNTIAMENGANSITVDVTSGSAVVTGWTAADTIRIKSGLFANAATAFSDAVQDGPDVVVTLTASGSSYVVRLLDVTKGGAFTAGQILTF